MEGEGKHKIFTQSELSVSGLPPGFATNSIGFPVVQEAETDLLLKFLNQDFENVNRFLMWFKFGLKFQT